MKKIWHFSDTHNLHRQINVPEGIDIAIFTGDCSNPFDVFRNLPEAEDFIKWYSELNIPCKIFIAGNHDAAFAKGRITRSQLFDLGIIYLENEGVEIDGIKIWGSPITPTFGNWYFMKPRHKMHELWSHIPDDTDIIVTHGPPKGILDLSIDRDNNLDQCGCASLVKHVERIRPRYVMFGHIHNVAHIKNAGTYQCPNTGTVYSNGSCVEDGQFDKGPTSHGNILEYF